MFGPSPHSVWDGKDLIDMIGPLWGETDEAKRIAGWKAVDKYIAEEGEVIPLLQYVQPIIARKAVKIVPAGQRHAAAAADHAGVGRGRGAGLDRSQNALRGSPGVRAGRVPQDEEAFAFHERSSKLAFRAVGPGGVHHLFILGCSGAARASKDGRP